MAMPDNRMRVANIEIMEDSDTSITTRPPEEPKKAPSLITPTRFITTCLHTDRRKIIDEPSN
jgi:hypothetical protein